jgi:hypothetical protein
MISSRLFHIDARNKQFIGDISDFGSNSPFGRIYPDACDAGFTMLSHKTGQTVVWCLMTEMYDGEGEVTSWSFSLTPESIRKYPELEAWTCLVFND